MKTNPIVSIMDRPIVNSAAKGLAISILIREFKEWFSIEEIKAIEASNSINIERLFNSTGIALEWYIKHELAIIELLTRNSIQDYEDLYPLKEVLLTRLKNILKILANHVLYDLY
jgi:hypothetical protein